ncbi:MAG: histidinol-phosphate transaminase [Gammaproteobacteria bacterium]|nr:histidinol-phosphate transaminase [Gammaproteobacteria bacterium]MYF37865.1 histidinol-phosphate transaminase [Gammaproteobacteria bacterium]
MKNVNASISELPPYVPSALNDETSSVASFTDVLQLACNENPRGPSPAVLHALRSAQGTLNRYPDSDGIRLKTQLAERLGVSTHQITLGSGSSGVLDLITRVALSPNSETIVDEYCFTLYPILIRTAHGRVVSVPAKNWKIDFSALLDAVTEKTRLIFITNPGNPLGTCVEKAELITFLDALPKRVWLVMDEAYMEYVQTPNFPNSIQICQAYPNVILTRTFSKVYGLASLRVGYGIASDSMTEMLNRVRPPFNVNSLALVAAEVALQDSQYVAECIELNETGRVYLYREFERMGLEYLCSQTNFITLDCGREAASINQDLKKQGVVVRTLANYNLPNHLRVTIGLPEENERFVVALQHALLR